MRQLRLSIVGFGTVGRWLAAAVHRRRAWLAAECGVAISVVSVATRRDGNRVLYSLAGEDDVIALLKALGRVGERNAAEIERVMAGYFRARDAMEPVTRKGLIKRLREGLVTVLDVRPETEFALGHLPSALNIAWPDLKKRLAELPKEREIVAYCRGPYCVLSFEAVAMLRARGYAVHRLEDGFPEWKAAGLPVEGGASA